MQQPLTLCRRAVNSSSSFARRATARPKTQQRTRTLAASAATNAAPTTTAAAAMASPEEAARRRKGAIMGALVADAATMGLHWIYDRAKLDALLASKGRTHDSCEFFEPPSCPFYSLPSGQLSPYGAETAALLGCYARGGGGGGGGSGGATTALGAGAREVAAATAAYFKDVYAGYRNKSVKSLIANVEAGNERTGDPTDTQANMICKAAIVAAAHAGAPTLPSAVDAAVRAQQDSDAATEYGLGAALLLERVVLGATVKEAIDWAAAAPQVPERARTAIADASAAAGGSEPLAALADRFGVSCAMPGALQVAVAAAARADSAGSAAFEAGVRANMAVGGDNASRACFLGALLGAAAGDGAPPAAWAAKVTDNARFEAEADAVVGAAAAAATAGQK